MNEYKEANRILYSTLRNSVIAYDGDQLEIEVNGFNNLFVSIGPKLANDLTSFQLLTVHICYYCYYYVIIFIICTFYVR